MKILIDCYARPSQQEYFALSTVILDYNDGYYWGDRVTDYLSFGGDFWDDLDHLGVDEKSLYKITLIISANSYIHDTYYGTEYDEVIEIDTVLYKERAHNFEQLREAVKGFRDEYKNNFADARTYDIPRSVW